MIKGILYYIKCGFMPYLWVSRIITQQIFSRKYLPHPLRRDFLVRGRYFPLKIETESAEFMCKSYLYDNFDAYVDGIQLHTAEQVTYALDGYVEVVFKKWKEQWTVKRLA